MSSSLFSTVKITDRITRIVLPGRVFAYLVKGDDRAVLIDTGLGYGSLKAFVEELLGGMPYEVILTHGHLDHAGGAIEFDRVWITEKDIPIAAQKNRAQRAGYLAGNDGGSVPETELFESKEDGYLVMEIGQTFDLGGETLEILDFGGHTPGSVGVLFKEERILLTGDACCSHTLIFGRQGSLSIEEYREKLMDVLKKYGGTFDTMLYSHPHNFGGPEIVQQMVDLCGEILEGKDEHIPMDLMGRPAFLAKAFGPDGPSRADGGIANVSYFGDNIRKNRDKHIMSFIIEIEEGTVSDMKGPYGGVTFIPFTGYVESDLFTGKILPGAADIQVENPAGCRNMCAKYMFKGTDFKGKDCFLFVENNGWFSPADDVRKPFISAYPRFITDSAALGPYLSQARFRSEVHGREGGVEIRIIDVIGD